MAKGDRRANISMEAVASLAEVSKSTVSRIINGVPNKASDETRTRVLAAIEKLGYTPVQAGSTLRSGRSRIVAVMTADTGNAYNVAIASSLERAIRAQGRVMILCGTDEDPVRQDEQLAELRSHRVCGIVMLSAVESPGLDAAIRANEPIVFVNRKVEAPRPVPYVALDNYNAAREVGLLFSQLGFERILTVHGPTNYTSGTRDRVAGFADGVTRNKRTQLDFRAVERSRIQLGYAVASDYLASNPRPEAVFCTTDEIAYGFAACCSEMGIDLYSDIFVFGFDGNPLNRYLAPWLSTVVVPYDQFGDKICQALDITQGKSAPIDTLLPYHIEIRRSNH